MNISSKIYIAGHNGMVGSAILRHLQENGFENFVFTPYPEYDLINQATVQAFFEKEKPEYVFLSAAKVGGILANNKYRGQFIYENLQIQNNIIHESYVHGVKKLLFLGSSCIYPKFAPQAMKEEYLLTNDLEYTNEPYAIAKIAGLKLCESYNLQYKTNFISVMPTNLYGKNDNYDLEKSHVLPALIRKIYLGKCLENDNWEAIKKDLEKNPIEKINENSDKKNILNILKKYGIFKEKSFVIINLWGTGSPKREFLLVNDLAEACVFLMQNYDFQNIINDSKDKNIKNTHINIGVGKDLSIKELAEKIKKIVDFKGNFFWDNTKPDGTPRKLLNVDKINNLGWKAQISLEQGIKLTYQDYIN